MRTAAAGVSARGAKGVVLEGRDIGTVVFPNAALKFYIHADIDARTARRAAELKAKGELVDFDGLQQTEFNTATKPTRAAKSVRWSARRMRSTSTARIATNMRSSIVCSLKFAAANSSRWSPAELFT